MRWRTEFCRTFISGSLRRRGSDRLLNSFSRGHDVVGHVHCLPIRGKLLTRMSPYSLPKVAQSGVRCPIIRIWRVASSICMDYLFPAKFELSDT